MRRLVVDVGTNRRRGANVREFRRRDFLAIAGVLLAVPASTRAQNSKPTRIGLKIAASAPAEMAGAEPSHPSVRAFVQALRELGYQEGRNLILERRSAEGRLRTAHGDCGRPRAAKERCDRRSGPPTHHPCRQSYDHHSDYSGAELLRSCSSRCCRDPRATGKESNGPHYHTKSGDRRKTGRTAQGGTAEHPKDCVSGHASRLGGFLWSDDPARCTRSPRKRASGPALTHRLSGSFRRDFA